VAEKYFSYRMDDRWSRMARAFGVRPEVDGVTVDEKVFVATYGRKRVEVPRSQIDGAHITRDYTWYKAIGTRLSFVDDGLTFGTCTEGGVCVHFAPRIPRVIGFRDHSALTVTVEDLEGLVAELDLPG
jgi:hypothetical protein